MEVISEYGTVFLILAIVFGLYMTWGIGANDVANAMGTSVGSRALTIKQAILIAMIFEFLGAYLAGGEVTSTIRKVIIDPSVMTEQPELMVYGMMSALLAAATWLLIASIKGWPVSTTHSIVGAMIGFGIMAGGFSVINWGKLGAVIASWVISPLFSLMIAWSMFNIIVKFVLRRRDAFRWALMLSPVFIGLTVFVVVLSFVFKTPLGKTLSLGTPVAIMTGMIIALLFGLVGRLLLTRFVPNDESGTEEIFRKIQIGTSCYVALAQGANDVANAIGPLAVIYFLVKTGTVGVQVPVPIYLLLFGGVGIACGIGMAGHRVMDTIGRKITTLTNTRGFSVDFAAATTVMVASKLGLPVSTSQGVVGAILGIGFLNRQVDLNGLSKVVVCWIGTPVGGLIVAIMVYMLLSAAINRLRIDLFRTDILLRILLIAAGSYAAYALGANNVANVTAVFVGAGHISALTATLIGGLSIALGILTFSRSVMETVGRKLVRLDPFSALVVVLAEAITVHFFTFVGVPVSTSQAVIGAVLGVGIIKGAKTVSRRTLSSILIGWILTPAAACIIAIVLYVVIHLKYLPEF